MMGMELTAPFLEGMRSAESWDLGEELQPKKYGDMPGSCCS